ncbi:bolA-like protein 3 [[Candida] anglica]|uniref:BolA-like protein 3 n=1 Tax=[Candida] anglica TaxID=148631 RepID=A0ABP0ENM2_9ASCO
MSYLARAFKQVRAVRFYSPVPEGAYEKQIYTILEDRFKPSNLEVKDVSGGCGSMFAILVESTEFKGIPMIKQHRLVNEVLKDEISKWHGLQLKTKGV